MTPERDAAQARVAAELAELIRLHGRERLSGGPAVRALLNDRLGADAPAHAREVRVVADAASEGVHERLATEDPATLAAWFSEETGYDADVAAWAVTAWMAADGRAEPLPEVRERILAGPPFVLPAAARGGGGPVVVDPDGVGRDGVVVLEDDDGQRSGRRRQRWLVGAAIGAAVLLGGAALAATGGGSDDLDPGEDAETETTADELTADERELLALVPELEDCAPHRDDPRLDFTMLAGDGEIVPADIDQPRAMLRCSVPGTPDLADAWLFEDAGGASAFFAASIALDAETSGHDTDGDEFDDVEYYVYDSSVDESATLVENLVANSDVVIAYSVERGSASELLEWYDAAGAGDRESDDEEAEDAEPPFDVTEVVRDPDRVAPHPNGAGYDIGDCAEGTGTVVVDLTPTPCTSSSANLRVVAVVFRVDTCPDDAVVELTSTIVVDDVGRGAFYCFADV